jgi:hypothetical protein
VKTFGNGAFPILTANYNIALAGTDASLEPHVTIGNFAQEGTFTLNSINEWGSGPHSEAYGSVELNAFNQGLVVGNLNLSYGQLLLGTSDGGSVTIESGLINSDSTLKIWGGRYEVNPTTIHGLLVVAGGSMLDAHQATIQGPGTIYADHSTVTIRSLLAGLRVDLISAGLVYTNTTPEFGAPGTVTGGTIYENPTSAVSVLNAATSTEEIFHRSTGILDLQNAAGATTAQLRFAPGDSQLYTTPTASGVMDITTAHHAGSLPTIFA